MSTIIVTGAAGFVGQRLVTQLHTQGHVVRAIARRPQPTWLPPGVSWISADLLDPTAYEAALRGADCVVHLAAVTGKAKPEQYQRGNVEATRTVLSASERAGVRRFVFVSSIAAAFNDRRYYPYAESKIQAEEAVMASPLSTIIVRPTMIFGLGSPVQSGLERLARLPFIPVFGSGRTRVQPVDVRDVVQLLTRLATSSDVFEKTTIELGGPAVFTIDELMRKLRALQGRDVSALLHLPLWPLRWVLAVLERPLLSVLPLTAGQLATFVNDGVARPEAVVERLLPERTPSPANCSAESQ